ncbi:hypothetical protein [Streptomyces sp. NBC_00046]|uniref:hypothetical protein n=1 Tax=unclassified Streptomyces TaxID=2593676 RepID=UPI0032439A24
MGPAAVAVATGELDTAPRSVRERGLPLLKVTADDFPLPALAGELAGLTDELENGSLT